MAHTSAHLSSSYGSTMQRRKKKHLPQHSHAALIQLLFLIVVPSAQSDHQSIGHRRTDVVLDTVERCTLPQDENNTALLSFYYRCFYRGTLNTQLTANCPEPYIDTRCPCSMAARSPMTGLFSFCTSCTILEYNGDWSVTYDCSNLWMKQQVQQQIEQPPEEETVFEQAGLEETSGVTTNTTTPAPTPSVRLSARNSRTFPPM